MFINSQYLSLPRWNSRGKVEIVKEQSIDALCFVSPDGRIIPPEVTRKFKLNLMGRRLVKV